MSNLSQVKSKAQFIAMLDPQAWDALFPHTPLKINDSLVELFVADAVKSTAAHINDKNLQKQGTALASKIASKAFSGMGNALAADGDVDICPPYWPWPGPRGPWFESNFEKLQTTTKLLSQSEIVSILVSLSAGTMEKEFNAELKQLGANVARGISGAFADEVEKCGTVPRKPFGGGPRKGGNINVREAVMA